jgi:hypothetical protein
MAQFPPNSKHPQGPANKPPKEIKRVVKTTPLLVEKSLGRKIKDVFIVADFKTVRDYIVYDVLLPAAKSTLLDTIILGSRRALTGDTSARTPQAGTPGVSSPFTNVHVNYGAASAVPRVPVPGRPPSTAYAHHVPANRIEYIFRTSNEADNVLESLLEVIQVHQVVSLGDLHQMIGAPVQPTDHSLGWENLGRARIIPGRDGHTLSLPPTIQI